MLPQCVLQAKQKNSVQTVVVKIDGTEWGAVLDTHCKAWIWNGGGAAARVDVTLGDQRGQYLVLTTKTPCGEVALAERLKKSLSELPGSPQVEWVRQLTRRLQHLFCWGDVKATREDVARAAGASDLELEELPQAGSAALASAEVSQLPALFDALRGTALALEECVHDWYTWADPLAARDKCAELKERAERKRQPFDEPGVFRWLMQDTNVCSRGQSAGASPPHLGPFWRCTSCRLALCQACAHGKHKEQRASREFEALKESVAAETPNGVRCRWRQHPERPLPFFVIDHEKLADQEKVLWMRQDLGDEAALPEFSAKYVDLFGSKRVGVMPQKTACLKLYAMYAPGSAAAAWKKEADLPPSDLAEFQRVWDRSAPLRCKECSKRLPEGASAVRRFCDEKCREAGVLVVCKQCTPEQKCSFCRLKPAPRGERILDQALSENQSSLKRWREVTGRTTRVADPEHEPAWKKRRRS
jgi:hypothetical protein